MNTILLTAATFSLSLTTFSSSGQYPEKITLWIIRAGFYMPNAFFVIQQMIAHALVIASLACKQSYSASGPVNTGMGDHLQ